MIKTVVTVIAGVAITMGAIAGLTSCRGLEPGTSTEVRNPDAGRDPEPVTDTSGNLVLTPKGGVGVDLGGGMYVKPGGGIGFGGIPFG